VALASLKSYRRERGGGAESAEGLVRYGIPFLALSTILILRRRDSAVSKDAL
tara:strand:- start:107596 stop:107751 length:156 start_codon:yes stop_codon:yes gene_type:complete